MYLIRVVVCFIFLVFFSSFPVIGKSKKLTVLGTLTEETEEKVIDAKTAGWTIQLNPVIMVDGQQIAWLEIKSSNPEKLEPLEDKFVQATGTLTFISSTDAGECPVLELSSIKERKAKNTEP
jgi:hypothetical protein